MLYEDTVVDFNTRLNNIDMRFSQLRKAGKIQFMWIQSELNAIKTELNTLRLLAISVEDFEDWKVQVVLSLSYIENFVDTTLRLFSDEENPPKRSTIMYWIERSHSMHRMHTQKIRSVNRLLSTSFRQAIDELAILYPESAANFSRVYNLIDQLENQGM